MISGAIRELKKSKILCAVNDDGTRQLTVCSTEFNYSTTYDNIYDHSHRYSSHICHDYDNTMVLPVPLPNSIKLHDLSGYSSIFEECSKKFTIFSDDNTKFRNDLRFLPVQHVGAYIITIVPNINKLENININEFFIEKDLRTLLTKSYNECGWGFIVYKLYKKGFEDYHPIAYSHDISNNKAFIPTKRYSAIRNKEDFPHDIYLININSEKNKSLDNFCKSEDDNFCKSEDTLDDIPFNFESLKANFPIKTCHHFEKIEINKNDSNIDFFIPITPGFLKRIKDFGHQLLSNLNLNLLSCLNEV